MSRISGICAGYPSSAHKQAKNSCRATNSTVPTLLENDRRHAESLILDPQNIQIAAAFMRAPGNKLALVWSDTWQAFVLPMTKLNAGPPAETAEQAAIRAAAGGSGAPCRVVPGSAAKAMRALQLSNRDGEIKDYHFTIVPVEIHPDFVATSTGPRLILVDTGKLQHGEYQPISPSIRPILESCFEWGWF